MRSDEGDGIWPMIHESENRGTAWEPDSEQAAAMKRRQRKQLLHVGLMAAAFIPITLTAQMTVMVLVGLSNSLLGDLIDFYGFTERVLMSFLPMYLIVFPAAVRLFQPVPKCGSSQKEQRGSWKSASFFVITVGIGLAGSILGRLVGILWPSGSDSISLDQLTKNFSLQVNLLTTVIMAPVVEKFLFRKLIMDRLLGYGQEAAIIMSGIMLGMAHNNSSQLFYAFGTGILWAYMHARTGKVGYTIGLYVLFSLLGGVIAAGLSKGAQGLVEGPWIMRRIESILGTDIGRLVTVFFSVVILAYFSFMLACLIATIILIIIYRRQTTFRPGQRPLRKGRALETAFLNAGMIVYLVIRCGSFILNW